jgi:hypothetical protein
VPGCKAFAYRIGRFCQPHNDRAKKYGDPTMSRKLMERRHYRRERVEVRSFLKRHASHVAVEAGLAWIATWIHSGDSTGDAVNQHIARLREAGVKPLDILTEVAAMFLYVQRYPFIEDGTALTFAMASAVLHLAPLPTKANWKSPKGVIWKRATGKSLRIVGETLRAALAPLLLNISKSIRALKVETKDQRGDLRAPFPARPIPAGAEVATTAQGAAIYTLGKSCPRGHPNAWHYAKSGKCLVCSREDCRKNSPLTGRPRGRPSLAQRIARHQEDLLNAEATTENSSET